MKKIISLMISLCLTMLCGCGGREIDDMAYVVAIGVDGGEGGKYDFTFAIGNPDSINSGGGENAGSGDSNVLILERESGRSIFTAGDAVSARIGQEINFSHAELLVFSESVAVGGVADFLDGLTRNLNQRPKLIPAVATTTAGETLEAINSKFEGNPEKYLKKVFESESSPVSSGINSRDFLCRTGNNDAGTALPRVNVGDSITVTSMSVFDSDRLVGAFDDVMSYKLLSGMGEDICYDVDGGGSLILAQRISPIINVECGDVPHIDITVVLDASIATVADDEAKEQLYSVAEATLKERIYSLLNYTSKGVGVDVLGFDKHGRKHFLTWDEWEEYDWHERYRGAEFNLTVRINPEKTGLLAK